MRNPEANIGAGRSFVVTTDGPRISFVDPDDKNDTISGTIDVKSDTVTAYIDSIER